MPSHTTGERATQEATQAWHVSGYLGLALVVIIDVFGGVLIGTGYGSSWARVLAGVVLLAVGSILMSGLTRVRPGQRVEVTPLTGQVGALSEPGFHFTAPLSRRRSVGQTD